MKNERRQLKLSIRRETLRRLDGLTDDQLRGVAGGTIDGGIASRSCTTTTTSNCLRIDLLDYDYLQVNYIKL